MVWLMMLVRMLDGIMRTRRFHVQYVPAYRPGSSGPMVSCNVVWRDNMVLGLGRLLWREVVRSMGTCRRSDNSSASQLGTFDHKHLRIPGIPWPAGGDALPTGRIGTKLECVESRIPFPSRLSFSGSVMQPSN